MASSARGHPPCGGTGTAPLQNACRVSRRGTLSVDHLAPQVTLEQPEHCLSTIPAPDRHRRRRMSTDCHRHFEWQVQGDKLGGLAVKPRPIPEKRHLRLTAVKQPLAGRISAALALLYRVSHGYENADRRFGWPRREALHGAALADARSNPGGYPKGGSMPPARRRKGPASTRIAEAAECPGPYQVHRYGLTCIRNCRGGCFCEHGY